MWLGPGERTLGGLSRTWILFFERIAEAAFSVFNFGAGQSFTARALLPGSQTVDTDVLSHRYRVVLLSDALEVALILATVTAKTGLPTTADYIADILVSHDEAATWESLFITGLANKIVLPIGEETAVIQPPIMAVQTLQNGDQLRVDVLQADATVNGIELVLLGRTRIKVT
jgi:hypothetical protein